MKEEMKKQINYVLVFSMLFMSFSVCAQKERIIGFWEIQKVEVGDKNMTPVAKWTKINTDGSFQSGNGWLQNAQGSWNYDAEKKTYSAIDALGIKDDFGGFVVSFDKEKMIWEREEEGMSVKVTLSPITAMPMAPADYLVGIWDLVEITENEHSIINDFDGKGKHKLFIRWDRIFINFSPEGERLTGYWHINGHKPEITLLPHQADKKPESWEVTVNEKTLYMKGISDDNQMIQRKYVRRNTF